MGQWQRWMDKHSGPISRQLREPGVIDQARMELGAISEPMPDELRWVNRVQRSDFASYGAEARGSALEFLLSCGDMSLYREFDARSSTAHAAVLKLGDALVAKGARPSARMITAALATGLSNLDGPERLEAAFRWGAKAAWDPQDALARCCERSAWDAEGGARAFAILEREGALTAPGVDFESCPADRHPIVRAAMSSDAKTMARLIEKGVSVQWRDPRTGVTLWHVASALSASVGKALLPALSRRAPELAGLPTLEEALIPELHNGALKIRKGQTPLHCACDGVKPAALEAALACGAPADEIDCRGDSPLTLLSRRWGAKAQAKGEPMAKALLLAGADPGRKDKKGLTPAQNMAAKGPLGALTALLRERPQDVGADDEAAKAAFERLAGRGSEGLARAEEAAMSALAEAPKSPPKPGKKTL